MTALDARSQRMLELLAQGAGSKLIAKELGYQDGTMRVYLHNLYRKLGVANKTEAVIWFLRRGGTPERAPEPASAPLRRTEDLVGETALADGLFAIVKLMELLARANVRLSEVRRTLPRSTMAQTKVPCRWEHKGKVMRILNEQYDERSPEHNDGIKIELGDEWVLILHDPDGPFIHVIAEGTSDEQAKILTEKYAGLVMGLQ
jgi:DNA-binding CsgD family transcriptional regulator